MKERIEDMQETTFTSIESQTMVRKYLQQIITTCYSTGHH